MREGAGEIDHKFKKGSSQIAFKDTNLHSIDLLADLYLFLMAYGTNVPLFSHNTGVKIRVYNLSEWTTATAGLSSGDVPKFPDLPN